MPRTLDDDDDELELLDDGLELELLGDDELLDGDELELEDELLEDLDEDELELDELDEEDELELEDDEVQQHQNQLILQTLHQNYQILYYYHL